MKFNCIVTQLVHTDSRGTISGNKRQDYIRKSFPVFISPLDILLMYDLKKSLTLLKKEQIKCSTNIVKGTVSRDISSPVFFFKQLLLVQIGTSKNYLEFF
jgi:hypothetical protein